MSAKTAFVLENHRSELSRSLGPLRLVDALGGLVVGQSLRRVHVAEGRMRGNEVLGRLDAEALCEHGAERLDLHLSEAGEAGEVGAQGGRVRGVAPDPRGVP